MLRPYFLRAYRNIISSSICSHARLFDATADELEKLGRMIEETQKRVNCLEEMQEKRPKDSKD
jgi:hypothetical protein